MKIASLQVKYQTSLVNWLSKVLLFFLSWSTWRTTTTTTTIDGVAQNFTFPWIRFLLTNSSEWTRGHLCNSKIKWSVTHTFFIGRLLASCMKRFQINLSAKCQKILQFKQVCKFVRSWQRWRWVLGGNLIQFNFLHLHWFSNFASFFWKV